MTFTPTSENLPRPSTPSLHPLVQRILQKRGYLSEISQKEMLSWDLKELPELTQMQDMEKAALRIVRALDNGETIGIYGDYDVDGTTSCALFYHFFQLYQGKVDLFQPGRFVEGYGLHLSSIDQALEKGIDLLITVDCGITNNEAALYALEKNLDLIITDHHKDVREEIPRAFAVVNPNRRDEPEGSPLKTLAGVGVAFALCLKVKKELEKKDPSRTYPSLYPLLQWVAVGTVCDLALLNPVNLKLVRHGLKQMKDNPCPGLKVFLKGDEGKKTLVPSEKLSFHIGPLINSKGRIDHPERALRVLVSPHEEERMESYRVLEVSNQQRKFLQGQVYQGASSLVLKEGRESPRVITIVYDPSWHEGVIGIVASKLVETFKVPAVVLTRAHEGKILKASARTAGKLDIFHHLKECQDLFLKFGGHAAAAGFSLKEENLRPFRERMEQQLSQIPSLERTQQETFDVDLLFDEVTPSLVRHLERLEPFGRGNEKPRFRLKNVKISSFTVLKEAHVRWDIISRDPRHHRPLQIHRGISFNYLGKIHQLPPEEIIRRQEKEDVSLYFTLDINAWGGKESLQLMVERLQVGE